MYKAVLANNPAKTVKLTPTSSNTHLTISTLVGRYAAIRRRCAQTARISLHYQSVSKSDRQTKNERTAKSLAYPFAPYRQVFRSFPWALAAGSFRSRHISASVERYLRRPPGTRKREKRDPAIFFAGNEKFCKIGGLPQYCAQEPPFVATFLPCRLAITLVTRSGHAAARRRGAAFGKRRSANKSTARPM